MMKFRLLGIFEVLGDDENVIDVGTPKQRALLALLALQVNRVVSVSSIVDGLWGDDPPSSAANVIQGYVSRLRKSIAPDVRIVTVAPGYRLELAEEDIDVTGFERLVAEGRNALERGKSMEAAATLDRALTLCRGPALSEFVELPFAVGYATRLDRLAHSAEEDLAEARLAQGHDAELLPELERLVEEEPFSERRWGHLMTALYRAGRQAHALAAYQRARTIFVEQLGLEPGPELRKLEAGVLAQSLSSPAPLPQGAVSFLLTDIEGSTRLWEENREAMAVAVARHDEIAIDVVGRARGQLRKTRGEGDSTFSVFASASDAVFAALELQVTFGHEPWPEGISLRVRAVVHTGEAQVRDGDYFGPAVNRAARARSLARGGQVLITAATAALVSDTMPAHTGLRDLGQHKLKDLDRPEQLFQLTHRELADDFDPLATVGAPTNLPSRSSSLIGRDTERDHITASLAENRLVTLTGPGGCGKTSLAIAAAGAATGHFPDGVWFVDLAKVSSGDQVIDAIAGVLAVRERPSRTLTHSVAEYMGPQRALLLMDNCEHVRRESASVVEAVLQGGSAVKVLATSRERLGLAGEVNWAVPQLEVDMAIHLFAERARQAQPTFDVAAQADVVAELCERLDGMPLAIELAAARVNVLSVEQISARLGDAVRLLNDEHRAAVPRQRTLRATLEWSFELLTEPERRLFERLGVFAGGFNLEAAEAVGSSPDVQREDVVGFFVRLVDKSLVVRTDDSKDTSGPRYRLLEALRQYALTRLTALGDDADVRTAHAAHYADVAEALEPRFFEAGSRRWFDQINLENGNLRAALEWTIGGGTGDTGVGVRLVGALSWPWFVEGRIAEGREWAGLALAVTEGSTSDERCRALTAAALLATAHSDLECAAEASLELITTAEKLGAPKHMASGYDLLGIARWAQGRLDESIASHLRGQELNLNLGMRWDLAAGAAELGRPLTDAGRIDEARAAFALGVKKARALGEEMALGFTLDASAAFALRFGEVERAATEIDEAVEHYRASGYLEGVASGLNTRAYIALEGARLEEACRDFGEAFALCRRLGHVGGAANAVNGVARITEQRGNLTRSVQLLAFAESLRTIAGSVLADSEQSACLAQVARLESAVGPEAFREAWVAGNELELDGIELTDDRVQVG